MRKKIATFIDLVRKRDYRTTAFTFLSYVPSNIFVYDRFYFVTCKRFNKKYLRPLKNEYELITIESDKGEIKKIQQDLNAKQIDWAIGGFQLDDNSTGTKIIKIDKAGRTIAITFVRKVNTIQSPSHFSINFGDDFFATWVLYTYVHPDFRLKGYHVNLLSCAYDLSRENHSQGLFGEIRYINRASIQSHAKLGFEVYKNVQYIKIFNKRFFLGEQKRILVCIRPCRHFCSYSEIIPLFRPTFRSQHIVLSGFFSLLITPVLMFALVQTITYSLEYLLRVLFLLFLTSVYICSVPVV